MAASQPANFNLQEFTDVGQLLVGGRLYTYAYGTTAQKTAFTDPDGTVPHTYTLDGAGGQYIALNARGELPAPLYLVDGSYDIALKRADGSTVWTRKADGVENSIRAWMATLATAPGASFMGFIQLLVGAKRRAADKKMAERVSVADFLDTDTPTPAQVTTALQAAINSSAKRVYVSRDYQISDGVVLAANQIIDLDGGSLTLVAGAVPANGVFYAKGKANIKILDPVIDVSATVGIAGINLIDCPRAEIVGGRLSKCNLNFQSTDATARMGYKATGTVIDLAGFNVTAVYVSGAKGVLLLGLEMFGGKEGLGIYNGATMVREIGCESYGHTQDGSVIINGNKIVQLGNLHHDNGQSGYTTQRPAAPTDCQDVVMLGNISSGNAYDGYDLRGATTNPWGVDMRLAAVGNISVNNAGTGIYSVNAEGVVQVGNIAGNNALQGALMNKSARNIVIGMYSSSNANGVAAGPAKAGILIQDSPSCAIAASISSNSNGATQGYGLSFTGTSIDCSVAGGYYQNNSTLPLYLNADGASAYVTAAAMQTNGNVWTHGVIGHTGAYIDSGFGAPIHTRNKGSTYQRTDGGNGELYLSNGAGAWTLK